MRKTRHILYSLLAASLMTACTQDEHTGGSLPEGRVPMVLNAGGLQVTATPDTRGIFDGDWSDVTQIAVTETSTDEGKKTYTVTPAADYSTAELAPEDEANTIWWNYNDEKKDIIAWHPVDKEMPQVDGSWTVTADQRDGIPVDEDLLYASGQVTLQNPYLTFRHLLSKVVINIRQSDYLQNYSLTDVEVTMDNICLDGKFELSIYEELILNNDGGTGTIVHPHRCDQAASGCFATYEALVMPQTVTMDNRNIIIQVDGVQYVWEISLQTIGNNSFDSGCQYTFNITVDAKGLDVQVSESIDWNATNPGSGGITLKDTFDQATNAYYVYTAKGLEDWVQTVRGGNLNANCILFNDIDLEGAEWTAIGDPVNQYAGTFDGGGHTIRNIKIKDDAQNNGLFGNVADGGIVKNLTVENASMTTSGTKNYGIIAAWNDGTIENCVVSSCDITGSSGYVGCFSSENRGRISRCRVDDVNVLGDTFGGIVWNNQGRIEASSFQGHINADGGALAEWNLGGTIIACWTNATHQEGKTVAGIVRTLLDGSVTACYYGGDIGTGILEDRTGTGDATKVDGSSNLWNWEFATGSMNNKLGPDFGWHWQTDNRYTLPTLVPNN